MKKTLIVFFFTLLLNKSFAQDFPFELSNQLTSEHVNIVGTKLFIIPPVDFEQGGGIVGFHKDKRTVIQVFDVLGGDFYKNSETFTQKELEKQGLRVLNFKYTKIQKYSGRYAHVKSPNATGYMLVFGDTTFVTSISTVIPIGEEKYQDVVLKSLNSICYNKDFVVQNHNMDYECDDKNTIFKFAKTVANLSIYSINGVVKTKYDDEPFVSIIVVPKDANSGLEQVANLFTNQLERNGYKNIKWLEKKIFKRNGSDILEFELSTTFSDTQTNIYFQIIGSKEKAVVTMGTLTKSNLEYKKDMKSLADSIKIKY